ncbi:MAG: Trm112 family protein [Alphaproteobacteria bacterium]|nr:Trm112 family protein [Alphaproteobacteria bacterium]
MEHDTDPDGSERPLSPVLRALLVCPVCKGDLDEAADGLRCPACALTYPVVDGVPFMLPERAQRG